MTRGKYMARPIEFNEEVVKKLEEIFAIDGSIEEACFWANITRQTYYNHVKENGEEGSKGKELFDRFTALRNRPILKARQTIVKSLDDPNFAFRYLEKKRKKEFGNAIDVTSDNKPIPILNHVLYIDNGDKQDTETEEEN